MSQIPKLIIMRGLPASGKSTRAREIMDRNTVRINRDLLRTMLHFDEWSFKREDATRQARDVLIKHFISQGKDVIVDDTNLGGMLSVQFDSSVRFHLVEMDMNVPVQECIKRDALREKKVGADVIYNMALRHGLLRINRPVVICDLDGTMCDIKHRLPHVRTEGQKKDWKAFFAGIPNDTLRRDVHDQVEALSDDCEVIFVSARPENHKEATLEWLDRNVEFPWLTLIMRKKGDGRPDTEVKQDIYNHYLKDLDIKCVFDDRPCVIRMWRELGLNVINVGDNIEF